MLFTLNRLKALIITSTCTRAYNFLGIVLSRIAIFKLYGFRPALFQVFLYIYIQYIYTYTVYTIHIYIYSIYNTYIKRGITTQKIT